MTVFARRLIAHPELTIEAAVNRAVNETLGRTILTSLCTFFTVSSLWLFGGKVIEDFAFTLMIGITVGTYSSIFIASSIVVAITHHNEKRIAKMKATGQVSKKRKQFVAPPEPKLFRDGLSRSRASGGFARPIYLNSATKRACPRAPRIGSGNRVFSGHHEGLSAQRGLANADAIRNHLAPKFESLHHPMSIRDMDKAVQTAFDRTERRGADSRVYGDYDVDGTTGAALLSWLLREFGFQFSVKQPDRFKDGYGLNVGAVEQAAAASGVKVLITVDCGISSFDAASKARELGIDLIIVDHHQLDAVRGLPPAIAVLNPQRPDCESGLKQLCGCGLAFYLAMGLRIRGREEGWFTQGAEPNLKQHLDLVVMATAADMVPLTGDNHVLVRHGMDVLKQSKKPGVRALLEVAGSASKDMSPSHLGFVLVRESMRREECSRRVSRLSFCRRRMRHGRSSWLGSSRSSIRSVRSCRIRSGTRFGIALKKESPQASTSTASQSPIRAGTRVWSVSSLRV